MGNMRVINARFQLRKDTLDNWEQHNPTILDGERVIVVSGQTQRTKTGDGTTAFIDLPYDDEIGQIKSTHILSNTPQQLCTQDTQFQRGIYLISAQSPQDQTYSFQFMIHYNESLPISPTFYLDTLVSEQVETTRYKFMAKPQPPEYDTFTLDMFVGDSQTPTQWEGIYIKLN